MTILSHWLPAARLLKALQADHLPGLWRHWIPRAGREVTGLCLGDDHDWWHNPGAHTCVLLDECSLPGDRVWRLNSQEVWELTEALKGAPADERARLLDEARRDPKPYETDPTEWFVEGGLPDLRSAALGIVTLGPPGRILIRTAAEAGLPIEALDARYRDEDDLLDEAMDDAIARVLARRPAAAMSGPR